MVKDVFENCCTLEWQPPKDDGGEPIERYDVEKMDEATGQWVPAGQAKGTTLKVTGLKKGQTYQFRVKAVNKEGSSDPLQTEKGTVARNPYGKFV